MPMPKPVSRAELHSILLQLAIDHGIAFSIDEYCCDFDAARGLAERNPFAKGYVFSGREDCEPLPDCFFLLCLSARHADGHDVEKVELLLRDALTNAGIEFYWSGDEGCAFEIAHDIDRTCDESGQARWSDDGYR